VDLNALEHEKREDRYSTLLASLTSCEPFRHGIVQRVFGRDASTPGIWHVTPQFALKDGIADIVIEGPSCLAVVEAKIEADFTKGQPTNYARYLMERRAAAPELDIRLVLLAPEPRIAELEKVAVERLKKQDLDVPLVTVSWEETAETASKAVNQARPDERGFLEAYVNLIQSAVGKIPHPLTEAELSVVAGWEGRYLFSELKQLLRIVPSRLNEILGGELNQGGWDGGEFYFGLSVTYRDRTWWFGCWIDAWIEFGVSLLWIQAVGRLLLLPMETTSQLGIREFNKTSVFPLVLVPYLDRQTQATRLAEQFRRVIIVEEESSAK
jgi:hypothetical protein